MESGLKSAENNAHRTVTNVTFSNITATGGQAGSTQNEAAGGGCRVKSRPNSTGSVRDIRYEDMVFDGVYWPAKPPLVLPFRADYGPFSSWRGPRTALNCSYRGDRVTRAWPVGLRVRAAQTETRFGRSGGRAEAAHELRGRDADCVCSCGACDARANRHPRRFARVPSCKGGRSLADHDSRCFKKI